MRNSVTVPVCVPLVVSHHQLTITRNSVSFVCINNHLCLCMHTTGAWNLAKAPFLRWSEGDLWNVTMELAAGGVYEYK